MGKKPLHLFQPITIDRTGYQGYVVIKWRDPGLTFWRRGEARVPKEVWDIVVQDIGNQELLTLVTAGRLKLQS